MAAKRFERALVALGTLNTYKSSDLDMLLFFSVEDKPNLPGTIFSVCKEVAKIISCIVFLEILDERSN